MHESNVALTKPGSQGSIDSAAVALVHQAHFFSADKAVVKQRIVRLLFSIFIGGCLWTPLASAQRVTGEMVGTVRDSTQAVAAGVTLTLTHQETKGVRTITADNNGFYRAPTLEIGRYTIEPSLSG
jgi:hypothetical protein